MYNYTKLSFRIHAFYEQHIKQSHLYHPLTKIFLPTMMKNKQRISERQPAPDKGKSRNRNMPRNGRMGSVSSARSGVVLTDSDGEESFCSKPKTLEAYLAELSGKGRRREEALSVIVEALMGEPKYEFVEENHAMLLYWCLHCIKKGSAKELQLALQAIGVLGMMVGGEDYAHEVYEDLLPVVSQVIASGSGPKSSKVFDCLAMVSFCCASDADETESAMLVIWNFLNDKKVSSHSSEVVAVAISAWSLLLTSIDRWRLSFKHWRDAISYLLNRLDNTDNQSVITAVSEALVLIFEKGCLEKFSSEATRDSFKEDLKGSIIQKLSSQEKKTSDDGAQRARTKNLDVLKFFQDGECLETTYENVGAGSITLSSCTRILQLNFMKRFLGEDRFCQHLKVNENLHRIFNFTPMVKHRTGPEIYIPEREEFSVRVYKHEVDRRNEDDSLLLKRATMSPSSNLNKARTKLMNKYRQASLEDNIGHFIDDGGTEAD